MQRVSGPIRALALTGAVLLFLIAGGGTLAVAEDYMSREVLPTGAEIAGLNVAGLTRAEAIGLVTAEIADPLAQPIDVVHNGRTFTLDAGRMVTVDVEAMVEAAFAPKRAASLPRRVTERVLDRPSGGTSDILLTLDDDALDMWLDTVASMVDTAPADATMTLSVDRLAVVPATPGETVDREATRVALEDALIAGDRQVELAVDYTEPALTEDDLGAAILVDISERQLTLYVNGRIQKTYGVAVGTPRYPTPKGSFRITLKRYMPTWSNPGSAWAADMPSYIPPGPGNPLGTRALNLDAPGIRIHGTSADYSIGTAASHGCMRMHRWDIEELYELVDVGDPVFIVR
jgi:lipoprotein-anchoring transpeptidase ErfK/SrfK